MPLFGQRENLRRLQESGIPGLGQVAVRQGWEPAAAAEPFGAQLESDLLEIAWVLHGVPRSMMPPAGSPGAGSVEFSDAYRGLLDGKAVTFANAWTSVPSMSSLPATEGVAVCAVALSTAADLLSVQPRSFPPVLQLRETPAGGPAFAARFLVQASASQARPEPAGQHLVAQVLTEDVQRLMMARDDWFFRISPYALACITREPFGSVAELGQQITAVLAVAAAIPSLIMSAPADVLARPEPDDRPAVSAGGRAGDHGDHGAGDHTVVLERIVIPEESAASPIYPTAIFGPGAPAQQPWDDDDGVPPYLRPLAGDPAPAAGPSGPPGPGLAGRLSRLGSIGEALEMLQGLSPAERALLAGLDTPLAALAGVQTAEQAAERYRALGPQQKLQLAAMFMRPGSAGRARR